MNKFGLPDSLLDAVKSVVEKMDPVDKNALGKTFDKRKDKDIDNDGDVDDSDKYLHRRRKAIKKASMKETQKDKVILNPKDDEKSNEVKESANVKAVKELSKATKGSYVQKATSDLFKQGSAMSTAVSKGDSAAADKATKKATKRATNIQNLVHKGLYNNKEEKLDELSPETLKRYKDAVDKKHTVKGVTRLTSTGQVQKFKDANQMHKRDTGVARAIDRLKKEDVQRDADFRMVKVRLPDGKRVFRKVRKSMKVGGVKGQDNLHKAFYDEKEPKSENTKVKSGLENPHNCATHVYSEQWGEGRTINTMHADPDAFGNIMWYDVMFEHGIEKEVLTKDLKIVKERMHGHKLNKKEKK